MPSVRARTYNGILGRASSGVQGLFLSRGQIIPEADDIFIMQPKVLSK